MRRSPTAVTPAFLPTAAAARHVPFIGDARSQTIRLAIPRRLVPKRSYEGPTWPRNRRRGPLEWRTRAFARRPPESKLRLKRDVRVPLAIPRRLSPSRPPVAFGLVESRPPKRVQDRPSVTVLEHVDYEEDRRKVQRVDAGSGSEQTEAAARGRGVKRKTR